MKPPKNITTEWLLAHLAATNEFVTSASRDDSAAHAVKVLAVAVSRLVVSQEAIVKLLQQQQREGE